MKFDRLQASIANNSQEAPSLYMALCMVESLFEDLENACGELSQCPVGDERLPTKLIWLCRSVSEIYEEKDSELQRGRPRLDKAMEKLQATRRELEGLCGVAEELHGLQQTQESLSRELSQAQEAARQAQALSGQCDQARQQLALLRRFDPDTARQELDALEKEITSLQAEESALRNQLETTGRKCAQLRGTTAGLAEENNEARKQAEALAKELVQTRETHTALQAELERQSEELKSLQQRKATLSGDYNAAEAAIADLRSRIDGFQDTEFAPIRAMQQELQQELDTLEAEKTQLSAEYSRTKEARNQLTLDIFRQKEDNASLQEKLTAARRNLEEQQQEKKKLDDTLAGCLHALERIQEAIELLQTKTLPEAEHFSRQAKAQQEALEAQLAQARQQREHFQEASAGLEASLPGLEEQVQKQRVIYDALTASCTASTKELESLERQIAELRSNSAEEKLEIYRKQLQEQQRQLGLISGECSRLEQEIRSQETRLKASQDERDRLKALSDRQAAGCEAMEKELQALAFAGSDKYAREVSALEERARLLETVHGKLTASLSNFRSILGTAPAEGAPLEDAFGRTLRDLRQYMDDLRRALLSCARSLKLEER